ncbi:MAG: hypothetical protein U0941_14445 [Planctomycetaceae bacterium]
MPNITPVPTSRDMWRAYTFAPSATPLTFAVLTQAFGVPLSAGWIMAAFVASYVVAGVIGMPIAFFLRHIDQLNAWTIHAAAFAWGVLWLLFCLVVSAYVVLAIGGSIQSFPMLVALTFCLMVPPVVLSGTVFWWLLKTQCRLA